MDGALALACDLGHLGGPVGRLTARRRPFPEDLFLGVVPSDSCHLSRVRGKVAILDTDGQQELVLANFLKKLELEVVTCIPKNIGS